MLRKFALSLGVAGLLVGFAGAQGAMAPLDPGDVRPSGELTDQMGIDQKTGAQVPRDARFMDEEGNAITFGELLGARPIVMLQL